MKAKRAHPMLVGADALQSASERRAQQESQQDERQQQQYEHDVIHLDRLVEVERRERADRGRWLEIDVAAVGAASDLRIMKNEIEHLRERERYHDEVDAARAQHE